MPASLPSIPLCREVGGLVIYAPALQAYRRQQKMAAFDSNRKSKMAVFSCTLLAKFKSNPPDQASSLHASVVQFELRTLGFGQGVYDRQTEAGTGRLG